MIDKNYRLRREYKINTMSNNFKVTYGTTNRLSPITIYIKLNTWVKYVGEYKDYNENINILNSKIKNAMRNKIRIDNIFDNIFFYNPELKKIINNNNSFHGCFEFTIRQKNLNEIDINKFSEIIKSMSDYIIETIEGFNMFEFSIKK